MGTSLVTFRGGGFWARDAALEVWLHLLAAEVAADATAPDWLRLAGEHWHEQAHAGLIGCLDPALDDHLSTLTRVSTALALCRRARDRLTGWGPVIPAEVLSSFDVGGTWNARVDAEVFVSVADAFTGLVRGGGVDESRVHPPG